MFNLYDELKKTAVKIIVKLDEINESQGSGCIVRTGRDDYDYVFTAKHCLQDGDRDNKNSIVTIDKITIKRYEADENAPSLTIRDRIFADNMDIAIIKVDAVTKDPPPEIRLTSPITKEDTIIYGYPAKLQGPSSLNPRDDVEAYIKDTHSRPFELKLRQSFETNRGGTLEHIVGLSGSGIFRTNNSILELVGILSCSNDLSAIYKFCGYSIDDFLALLEHYNDYVNLNKKDIASEDLIAHYIKDKLDCGEIYIKDTIKKIDPDARIWGDCTYYLAKMLLSREGLTFLKTVFRKLRVHISEKKIAMEIINNTAPFCLDYKSSVIIRETMNNRSMKNIAANTEYIEPFGNLYLKRAAGLDTNYFPYPTTGVNGLKKEGAEYTLQEFTDFLSKQYSFSNREKNDKSKIVEFLKNAVKDEFYYIILVDSETVNDKSFLALIKEINKEYADLILFFFNEKSKTIKNCNQLRLLTSEEAKKIIEEYTSVIKYIDDQYKDEGD